MCVCVCVQEEDMDVDGVEFDALRVFMHGVRADALAWSPESRLDKLPQMIRYTWRLCRFTHRSELQTRNPIQNNTN